MQTGTVKWFNAEKGLWNWYNSNLYCDRNGVKVATQSISRLKSGNKMI